MTVQSSTSTVSSPSSPEGLRVLQHANAPGPRGRGARKQWLGALTVTVRFSQAMPDTLILLLSQKRRVSLLGWVGASHLQLGGEKPRQG